MAMTDEPSRRRELFRDLFGSNCDLFSPVPEHGVDLGETCPVGLETLRTVTHRLDRDEQGRTFISRRLQNLFLGDECRHLRFSAWRGLKPVVEWLTGRTFYECDECIDRAQIEHWTPDQNVAPANPAWINFVQHHELG